MPADGSETEKHGKKKIVDDLRITEYEGIDAYTPVFGAPNNEVFRYQDMETKQYFADLWTKVKAY